jgi:methylglyoxal/glyoxal reductase
LEKLDTDGEVRAIGVSNFLKHHLKTLMETAIIKPVVNQIELHPKLVEKPTIAYCKEQAIEIESWSPLGRATYLDNSSLVELASKHDKSPAQIMIRWHLQNDYIFIPKSTNKVRQQENLAVFDFSLDKMDLDKLNQMEAGERVGSHPDHITR